MDKALYVGMNAASQNMLAQAVNANNLANASTTGFRSDFSQALALQVQGDGYLSRAYNQSETPASDFAQGPLRQTGNDMDIAIQGEGWISVVARDGSEAYSRAGELTLSPLGELMTADGLPVLGNAGPIALPPFEKLEIGNDGTLSIRELGQGPQVMSVLDRIKLVNPNTQDLVKGADGLFRRRDGAEEIADGNVRVAAGYLEGSNVNVVDAMVEMIALTRNYELNIKLMQTAERNSEAAATLLRIQ
ncbi:MAG: flagellar basal body rod protein FlgF [Pseudomonadales bacterium]|nr:flagellar basal body rod protein FlgF [Pseudomonadales bacterium]MCP5331368.1 flagellar basal body rod protein FlgF [Pseudomonadales bacterium]MCP5344377.1 flagellar basal body rod protein FlgF [Pseudomonadales bacterium]